MVSSNVIVVIAASYTVLAFLVQGTFASDVASWADQCSVERNRWAGQNERCLVQYRYNATDPTSTCSPTSRTLQRECTGFCHDGEWGKWTSHSAMCDATEMTCENAWDAAHAVSGCKNLAAPSKWTECPDCVTLAGPYFDCLLEELEKLQKEKCEGGESGGSRRGLFGGWAGTFGVFFVWQYIL